MVLANNTKIIEKATTWSVNCVAMIKMELESDDLTGQIAKLRGFQRIAENHMRPAAVKSLGAMEIGWKRVAPSASGRYKGSIQGKIKSITGLAVTGMVGTNVTNDGYPYPKLLEFSGKHHYRSTGRAGSRTRGQALRAIDATVKVVIKELGKAVEKTARDLAMK